jgi:hypothetical protein
MEVSKQIAKQQGNILMKAFNVTIFIGVYEVEGRSADELVRFVTCAY